MLAVVSGRRKAVSPTAWVGCSPTAQRRASSSRPEFGMPRKTAANSETTRRQGAYPSIKVPAFPVLLFVSSALHRPQRRRSRRLRSLVVVV
jgi:hypothetical protein